MKKNKSELTFREFAENLGYIKVIWNGKIIYSGIFIVEDFHHIILDIKGEQ